MRLESLEALWGVEARLHDFDRSEATIYRPAGFTVVEPRITIPRGTGWTWFLVYREKIDTARAARLLARLAGGSQAGFLGLKDACARVYQYIAVKDGRPETVEHENIKAWPLGSGGPPRLGLHGYNIFKIEVEAGRPRPSIGWIPGFYGPQRFGVTRPNSHYLGLLFMEARMGEVLREYRYRYPLEERREPGDYESRWLASRWSGMPRPKPLRIMKEALQAYIFNRALSRALKQVHEYKEHTGSVRCMGQEYRVPLARLPGPRLAQGKSKWAKLVSRILEEEGLTWSLFKELKTPFRPLLYPVCSLKTILRGGMIVLRFALPRGAYATSLLLEAYDIDWIGYDKCKG